MARIDGTIGIDTITGTIDADQIFGLAGNDKIKSGSGNDLIEGGDGNDNINGEAGDDIIYGGEGNDTLTGDAGNDTLYGGNGDDGFFGGGGNDTIFGEAGNDTLYGDGSNDMLLGGAGNNKLFGGVGNDTFVVVAREGSDTIVGNAGIDTLDLRLTSAQVTSALRADLIAYQSYMAAQITSTGSLAAMSALATGTAFTFASLGLTISVTEGLTISVDGVTVPLESLLNQAPTAAAVVAANGIEDLVLSGQIVATDGDGDALLYAVNAAPTHGTLTLDTNTGAYVYTPANNFAGTDSFAVIVSDPSGESAVQRVEISVAAVADPARLIVADTVVTAAQNLTGTAGNDVMMGGDGADTLSGGDGNDTIYGDSASRMQVALNIQAALEDLDGSETLAIVISGVPVGATLSAGTNNGDGSWTVTTADLVGLTLDAPTATDITLSVTATTTETNGDTAIVGATVSVTFDRGGGADTISDGAGNDMIYGGIGNDTLIAGSGNDTYDGGDGFDILDMSNANLGVVVDLSKNTAAGLGVDKVYNIEGVIGSNFADTITGSKVDSSIWGLGGNDKLMGGAGNDMLDGGAGNDTLDGGSGNDVLSDGSGDDTVSGGSGDDRFVAGDGADKYIGGAGFDVLDYSAATRAINVDASKKTVTGYTNDKTDGIEKYIGTSFNDVFKGGSTANYFDGGAGNDSFRGLGGSDVYTGGTGSDTFVWYLKDIISGNKVLGADVITDFGTGDALNLHEFLKAYPGANINTVVLVDDTSVGSVVSVKTSKGFIDLVILENVHGVTASSLLADGMIIA
jgi:Ca2+-binding RTX toxin-like protein